jgi:hypothetical protein
MWTEKGLWRKNSFFRTSTVGYGLILVWKYVERTLDSIDFEIIAFKGRRKMFFWTLPGRITRL